MTWTRRTRCHTSSCCVEVVFHDDGTVEVRSNTGNPITRAEWLEFLAAAKRGEFDELRTLADIQAAVPRLT